MHKKLLEFRQVLGYSSIGVSGVCHGFSLRWLEAQLLGERERLIFEARLQYIINHDPLELMAAIKKAQANKQPLTDEEQQLIDILAFYDSLNLYQSSLLEESCLQTSYHIRQNDIDYRSKFAASIAMEKQGGLQSLYAGVVILDVKEIALYLDNLARVFNQVSQSKDDVFGILLSSGSHVIALSYDFNQGWRFRDIDQPNASQDYLSVSTMATLISAGLSTNLEMFPYVSFRTSIILPQNNPYQSSLSKAFALFRKEYAITSEIAKRQTVDQKSLLFIAASDGCIETIHDLIKAGADVNQRDNKGVTPIITAAQNGYLDAVNALIEAGADINQVDRNGLSAILVAALTGHVAIIEALIAKEANVNQHDIYGRTPIFAAASLDRFSIIDCLTKAKADVNQANYLGFTPILVAVKNNHVEAVKALIRAKANIQVIYEANVPELTAVAERTNNPAVVHRMKQLIQQSPNPNKINLRPYDLAVVLGYTEIVQALEEQFTLDYIRESNTIKTTDTMVSTSVLVEPESEIDDEANIEVFSTDQVLASIRDYLTTKLAPQSISFFKRLDKDRGIRRAETFQRLFRDNQHDPNITNVLLYCLLASNNGTVLKERVLSQLGQTNKEVVCQQLSTQIIRDFGLNSDSSKKLFEKTIVAPIVWATNTKQPFDSLTIHNALGRLQSMLESPTIPQVMNRNELN